MNTNYWLGIDIGTGGSRALLVDHAGAVAAAHTVAHEDIRMDHALWAEQRPENWWHAAAEAIRGVLDKEERQRSSTPDNTSRPELEPSAPR